MFSFINCIEIDINKSYYTKNNSIIRLLNIVNAHQRYILNLLNTELSSICLIFYNGVDGLELHNYYIVIILYIRYRTLLFKLKPSLLKHDNDVGFNQNKQRVPTSEKLNYTRRNYRNGPY